MQNLTCVSGFWNVKNKYNEKYFVWFTNTLKIQSPYVFFSDKEGIEIIKKFRQDYPTYYIECNIEDFYAFKYKEKFVTHEVHCPSVELNIIWNEKIFLLQKAYHINPFNTEFFMWMDAGICIYRNIAPPNIPFPNINKLKKLPIDKFIYCSSGKYIEKKVSRKKYYHHISGVFILHKNIIDKFLELYKKYMEMLIDENNIWTEQVILTHIYKDNPSFFHKLCDGYGKIVEYLY
jgi:hypothetical protein